MTHHSDTYHHFQSHLQRTTPTDLEENLRVLASLLEIARALGVWPPQDPLEGIE